MSGNDQDSNDTEPKTQTETSGGGSNDRPKKTANGTGEDSFRQWVHEEGTTPYSLLQVEPDADLAVMRLAFRYFATKYHSDNPETSNEKMWHRVYDAWITIPKSGTNDLREIAVAKSTTPETLYHVLQVIPSAEVGLIREAYHHLLRKYHPDNKATGDPEKYKMVSDAYSVVSDPAKRAAYDKTLTNPSYRP